MDRIRSSPVKIFILFFALLLVAAALESSAPDPSRVVVIIRGDEVIEVRTEKTLVADVLNEAGIALDEILEKSYPELDVELGLDYIILKRATEVEIKADDQELTVLSWAATIEELLAEQDIFLDGDICNLPLEAKPETGQLVEVIRVSEELVYEEETIAAGTNYKNDSSLAAGAERVQTQAKDGIKRITYAVTYYDGIEVTRTKVGEEVISQPVTGIILRGTRAVASRGIVEGIASYYGAELHGSKTASGVPFDMYALTAAHRTLPFGSKVRVTFLATGRSVIVEINDRGPFVADRIIDLSAAAAKEIGLYAHGVGKVKLEVLK